MMSLCTRTIRLGGCW